MASSPPARAAHWCLPSFSAMLSTSSQSRRDSGGSISRSMLPFTTSRRSFSSGSFWTSGFSSSLARSPATSMKDMLRTSARMRLTLQ